MVKSWPSSKGYVPLPSYVAAVAAKQIASMTYNGTSLGLN